MYIYIYISHIYIYNVKQKPTASDIHFPTGSHGECGGSRFLLVYGENVYLRGGSWHQVPCLASQSSEWHSPGSCLVNQNYIIKPKDIPLDSSKKRESLEHLFLEILWICRNFEVHPKDKTIWRDQNQSQRTSNTKAVSKLIEKRNKNLAKLQH